MSDALPVEFRAVVVLADLQGLDYAEVAAALRAPLGTVKSRLARARIRLQECLQGFAELLPAAFRLNEERFMNSHDLELLSAYLDGQLDPSDSARFESRLASDESLRTALDDFAPLAVCSVNFPLDAHRATSH